VTQENQAFAGISVRDTGPGIAPEFLDQIFDPFFRIKQVRSGIKGLGLGLSIVRTLVELQGGTIAARSELGRGAELYFTIPLFSMMEPLPIIASTDAPRVLVVEDDQDSRQLVQDHLLAMGYRVQFEVDGARVLEAVQTGMFEGLMLNVGVSFVDGLAVLQLIRRSDQHIPIVMISTLGAKESAVRAIGMGAQAYVLKPFDLDELERVADYWFRPMEPLPSGSSEESRRPE